jgi:hypothetical protein
MAEALAMQREVSRVPWVFNTLLNDIEYRVGTIQPRSFPPEIHLSMTGHCNIECRFCGYTHEWPVAVHGAFTGGEDGFSPLCKVPIE